MSETNFMVQLDELGKMIDVCKKIMQTKHYAQMGESGVHMILSRAKTLGIDPFTALNGGFTCINGRVGMTTELMAALVRQRGHSVSKDPKSTAECVILHGKRADNGDEWTCSFSKDDAITAGLWNSSTWKKYPTVMLYNRAMSMLFRQLFPDLSLGAGYEPDEVREIAQNRLPIPEIEDLCPEIEVIEEKLIASKEQIDLFLSILALCSDEYKKNVSKLLIDNNLTMNNIPVKFYEKLLKRTSDERDRYLKEEENKNIDN